MSGLESIVKSIVEDNRRFREANTARFSKLLDVMQSGNADEFSATVSEILEGVTSGQSDEVLGDVGGSQSNDGHPWDATDAMGGSSAPQE